MGDHLGLNREDERHAAEVFIERGREGVHAEPQPTTSTARESMSRGNNGNTAAAPTMKAKVGTGKAREPRTDTRTKESIIHTPL